MQSQEVQRWDAVIFITLVMITCSYSMQEVPTLNNYLKNKFTHQDIQSYQFDQYISISQSMSFGVLIFFASYVGYLIDKYKPGIIFFVQSFFLSLSQFLIFISLYFGNFWILFAGRTLLYITCSPMFITSKVLLNSLTSKTYKGTSQGIAFLAVIGFGISLQLEPHLVELFSLDICVFITFAMTGIAFLLTFICYRIEQIEITQKQKDLQYQEMNESTKDKEEQQKLKVEQQCNQQEMSYLEQMKSLSLNYWIFAPINFISIIVITVIEVNGSAILVSLWNYDIKFSTQINSIPLLFGLGTPLLGYLYDKINKDYEWIFLSMLTQLIGIYLIIQVLPLIGFIIFGIGFILRISSQTPFITKIVPQQSLGKAFGLIRSLKDFFAMIMFFYVSVSVKRTHSYHDVAVILILISVIVLALSFVLLMVSKKRQN